MEWFLGFLLREDAGRGAGRQPDSFVSAPSIAAVSFLIDPPSASTITQALC
jgi:hypothetical protein